MSSNLIIAVSFVIVINCVTSIAKNSEEKIQKTRLNVTEDHLLRDEDSLINKLDHEIFSEGSHTVTNTSRSRGSRKGVNIDAPLDPVVSNPPTNETTRDKSSTVADVASSFASNVTITSSIQNITVPFTQPSTVKLRLITTTKTPRTTTTKLTTSTKATTSTIKPIRKPTITYSADDNAQILESEKNINYNVTTSQQSEDVTVPKTSSDTDRTLVDDEKSTRRSYVLFMGLAFALPMTFTLMHVMYKRIRNWMEIRHYQRVVSRDSCSYHD